MAGAAAALLRAARLLAGFTRLVYIGTALYCYMWYISDGKIVLRNLSVVEQHDRNTAQYLKENVYMSLSRYGIELHQIHSITTDNGTSMISMTNQVNDSARESLSQLVNEAFNEPENELVNELVNESIDDDNSENLNSGFELQFKMDETVCSVKSVRCAAHCLQLAVKYACQEIQEFFGTCRSLVRNLRMPNMALRLKQQKLQQAVFDTSIRWDSTADMLEQLFKLKEFCIANLDPVEESVLTSIEKYFYILQPCRSLSRKLQKEQLTFWDFYIAWMKCRLGVEQIDDPFARHLLTCISNQEVTLFENECFLAALYLDPRVNSILSYEQCSRARAVLA